jgi:hypothetical protein
VQEGAGVLTGGSRQAMGYRSRTQEWGPEPAQPKADHLVVDAKNLATASIDLGRARLSCAPLIDVKSDGPFDLRLSCSDTPSHESGPAGGAAGKSGTKACPQTVRLRLPRVRGRRIVSVVVTRTVGRSVKGVKSRRGRNLRAIVVRRPTTRAFTLRLRLRTSGGRKKARTLTIKRRVKRC